jgi:arabinogalactan oligomer / maltooligosaccharide transport system permease protein
MSTAQVHGLATEDIVPTTPPDSPQKRRRWRVAYWYLLPVALSALVFTVIPFFYTFYISFTNYHRVFRAREYDFIGLDNYRRALSAGGEFFPVLGWTFGFMFLTTLLNVGGGLFLALMLNHDRLRERNLYRTILIIPWALPSILTIQVWAGMFGLSGPINLMLSNLGMERVRWFLEEASARSAILMTNFWLS